MERPNMKIPGPDHPISVEPHDQRVIVTVAGQVIADSRQVLLLREASYPPVRYVPRSDVNMNLLKRTATTSVCPFKGTASYFSIEPGGRRSTDAVWSYESPHEAVAMIRDHLAFYPDRVDEIRDE